MKPQWENRIMSSMLQFVDHEILVVGEAFTNHGGLFYKTSNLYNGYYTYSSPFKQLVGDISVPNANVLTGVYVGGTFTEMGQGNTKGINYYKGQVYSDANITSQVSGNYATKDYNVYITNKTEQDLLFHTKYSVTPKVYQSPTGLPPETETYPAIFLKNIGGQDNPLGFGGLEDTVTNVRAVILSDSAFSLDAACYILKKTARKTLPIVENTPFNAMGALNFSTNGGEFYNYTGLATGEGPQIWDVRVSKLAPGSANLDGVTADVFSAFVDFELHSFGLGN